MYFQNRSYIQIGVLSAIVTIYLKKTYIYILLFSNFLKSKINTYLKRYNKWLRTIRYSWGLKLGAVTRFYRLKQNKKIKMIKKRTPTSKKSKTCSYTFCGNRKNTKFRMWKTHQFFLVASPKTSMYRLANMDRCQHIKGVYYWTAVV